MGVGAILALIGPPLFNIAEQIFKGDKLGPHRMFWVQAAAQQFIEFLTSGGKLQDGTTLPAGTRVPDGEMKTGLEALFQQSKKSGQLEAPVSSGNLFLVRGSMVPLNL